MNDHQPDQQQGPPPLAIRNDGVGPSLPVVKRRVVNGSIPPAYGHGLRIATYQGPLLCGDKDAIKYNVQQLEKWAQQCSSGNNNNNAQILVVGELFLCGYNIRHNDREDASVTQKEIEYMIQPIAIKNNIALLVPYAEKITSINVDDDDNVSLTTSNKMYDSMILIDKEGNTLYNYRKTQLWGKDEKSVWQYPYVRRGEQNKLSCNNDNDKKNNNAPTTTTENDNDNNDPYKIVMVNGIRIGMLNCYEAEFPELNRILALKGAQIIIIPTAADVGTYNDEKGTWSNWAYPDVSRTIIPSTAYHNHCFVAYVNHSLYQFRSDRTTLSGIYLGNTTIADPTGQTMVIADNVETMLLVDCIPSDYGPVHPNGQSNFIRDRRPELYDQLTSMKCIENDTGATYHYPEDPNKE